MKNIVITGCRRGIGYKLAEHFALHSNNIYATARNFDNSESAIDLSKRFPHVRIFDLDVSKPESIKAFSFQMQDIPIDILINNAGTTGKEVFGVKAGTRNIADIDLSDWQQVMNTNCVGPVMLSYALLENLKMGDDKKIINISSIVGSLHHWKENVFEFNLPYQTSKAALNMAISGLSYDLAVHDIITVAVLQGGFVAIWEVLGGNCLLIRPLSY